MNFLGWGSTSLAKSGHSNTSPGSGENFPGPGSKSLRRSGSFEMRWTHPHYQLQTMPMQQQQFLCPPRSQVHALTHSLKYGRHHINSNNPSKVGRGCRPSNGRQRHSDSDITSKKWLGTSPRRQPPQQSPCIHQHHSVTQRPALRRNAQHYPH